MPIMVQREPLSTRRPMVPDKRGLVNPTYYAVALIPSARHPRDIGARFGPKRRQVRKKG